VIEASFHTNNFPIVQVGINWSALTLNNLLWHFTYRPALGQSCD